MNKVVICVDRILDVESQELTIGGIQTYLQFLSETIYKSYSIKPDIVQYSVETFKVEFDFFNVIGIGVEAGKKNLYRYLKGNYCPSSTLLIWGSDQYSVTNKLFKSIAIQHGIAFDLEALEAPVKRFIVKSGFTWLYKFLQRSKARKLASGHNAVVCVDYNFPNWIRTYNSKLSDNYTVIPNFTRIPDEPYPRRSQKNILIARRFVRRRGIDIAIDIATSILNDREDVFFTFAGNGPEKRKIEILKNKYPDNIFIDSFSAGESLAYHKKFGLALIPSIGSEGTSLSLLEAMASGCVSIASSVGGMTNILIDDFNGYLVPPTANAFTEKLLSLLDDDELAERISSSAFLTVKGGFSQEAWQIKWRNLLDKFIASSD